ncbi:MAG: hypothetical protein GY943_19435 [Chloroflexi bacterium]|nr:hypothetical protein [Chloroflexota bacterium]
MSRTMISVFGLLILLLVGAVMAPVAAAAGDGGSGGETAVFFQDTPSDEITTTDDETVPGDSFFNGISSIFAILGVYIVTMFTMAIGTEILVDILKGILGKPLGLKGKPNTKKTLEQYKMFLPGKLDDLGISSEAKLRIEKQIEDLEKLLEPAFTAEALNHHLRQKEFSAALAEIGAEGLLSDQIDNVKEATNSEIQEIVANIDTTTTLGKAVQVALKKGNLVEKSERLVDRLARRAENVTSEQLYAGTVTLVSGEIASGVTAWTKAYINGLQEESYEAAKSIYENRLKPQIDAFGLSDTLRQKIDGEFNQFLTNLETYRGTDVYLESLNRILTTLENQREAARSGLGKWRDRIIAWVKQLLRRSKMQSPRFKPVEYEPRIEDSTQAASKLIDLEQYDKDQEKKRIRRLRLVSVVFGVFLSYALQVDSADLLKDLFPNNANFLYLTLISQDAALFGWFGRVLRIPFYDLTAGVILTGLAASAGSTFWHDQLGRLQSIKKQVDTAEQALRPIIIQSQQLKDGE